MREYQPFTYLIEFIPTGELYYGSKTAIGCHPCDLWTDYFTSSEIIEKLIEEFGKESFRIVHIKLHDTREYALAWEEMYLISVNADKNPNYLNQHISAKSFNMSGRSGENSPLLGMIRSEESKLKQGATISGKNHWNYGKTRPIETTQKMSESTKGEKSCMYGKTGALNKTSKKYIVIHPDGTEEVVIGMKEFCRNYGLDDSTMSYVSKGIYKQHKGYRCYQID